MYLYHLATWSWKPYFTYAPAFKRNEKQIKFRNSFQKVTVALLIYNELNMVRYNIKNPLKCKVTCNIRGYDMYFAWQKQKKECTVKANLGFFVTVKTHLRTKYTCYSSSRKIMIWNHFCYEEHSFWNLLKLQRQTWVGKVFVIFRIALLKKGEFRGKRKGNLQFKFSFFKRKFYFLISGKLYISDLFYDRRKHFSIICSTAV